MKFSHIYRFNIVNDSRISRSPNTKVSKCDTNYFSLDLEKDLMKVLRPQDFPADGTEAFVLDVAGETLGAEDVSAHRGEEVEAFLLQV